MAFCANCGTQYNQGVRFCPKCGAGVTAPGYQPPPQPAPYAGYAPPPQPTPYPAFAPPAQPAPRKFRRAKGKSRIFKILLLIVLLVAVPGAAIKHHLDFHTSLTPGGIIQDILGIPEEWDWTIYNLRTK
jgi:hypothetical protein